MFRFLKNRRILTVLGATLLVLAAMLWFGSASAQPAGASATWQLMDYQQSACFSPRVTTAYYGIWIKGTWTRPINIGISNLPSGGTYWTSYAPIPPGSSTGI